MFKENEPEKPLQYWRDMLDNEIMQAVWRGQQGGCHGNGIKMSDLAHQRLGELLRLGHTGLYKEDIK